MRPALLTLAAVVGSLAIGCAAAEHDDDTATSEGAATAATATKLASGHFDEVDLVVANGTVNGAYFSQVGDPAQGGATCSFTFTGTVTTVNDVDHATITAVDGWDTTTGTVDATLVNGKPGVVIRTKDLLNACMRSSPELNSADGVPDGDYKKMEAGVTGYATVGATKAYFYDHAGGTPRAAYVVQGDTIVETGAATNGFVPAKFSSTTGYLRVRDLATP